MGLNRAVVLAVCAGLTCGQSMDWASISPGDAGLDAAKLEAWRSSLAAHRTTGLIVIRRGRIALEWYAPEWDANRPWHGFDGQSACRRHVADRKSVVEGKRVDL